MKYLIAVLFLFSVFLTSAQNEIEHKFDYYSWNDLNEKEAHSYHYDAVIRAYQSKASPFTKWEIITQSDSTFLYLEYQDSSRSPYIIGNLLLVDTARIDTLHTFDPETFEEQHLPIGIIQHYFVKNGSWTEKTDSIYSYHYYDLGKKTGKANVHDSRKIIPSYQELIYRNDSLIKSKEFNLAINPNKDSIERYLIGKWNFNFAKDYFKLHHHSFYTNTYTFHNDGTFDYSRKNRHAGFVNTNPKTHFWYINDDYHLVLIFLDTTLELQIIDSYISDHIHCKIINETPKE